MRIRLKEKYNETIEMRFIMYYEYIYRLHHSVLDIKSFGIYDTDAYYRESKWYRKDYKVYFICG